MKYLSNIFFLLALCSGLIFISCSEDDPDPQNQAPTLENPISDLMLSESFGSETISLTGVFSDAETSNLSITATSSDQSVVTVGIAGLSLTVTEQGVGTSTISITAEDPEGATVSDQFVVQVDAAGNTEPVVNNPIDDLSLTEGFGTQTISLIGVFSDEETMMLQFNAESSNTNVVTTSISMADLTITEVGIGTSNITVTALDGDGGSVSDVFEILVSAESTENCTNDNSISSTPGDCDETPDVEYAYSESVNGDTRTIDTNGIPNHDFSNQNPTARELNSDPKTYTVDATPTKLNNTTSILTGNNRPKTRFGVGLNGVAIDPAPAEPFIFTITGGENDGEFNWDWVFEPTNNTGDVGLDCAMAHVQPDGTYHYHGDMVEYANTFTEGLGDGTFTPTEPVQIGWAADGFPILYKYGPDANGNLKVLQPGYQLKSGNRPGDGNTEPCGPYNGKYTNDYEFVSGVGDLDECNGVDRSLTLNGQTFSYFYVITDDFPVISRCFVGDPDDSFNLGGGGM